MSERAWAAAFGSGVPAPIGDHGVDPFSRWLHAVALGGHGRYAAAETVLRGLLTDPATPGAVAAHAAVTLGSHYRQQGGHSFARVLDARALRLADAAMADESEWSSPERPSPIVSCPAQSYPIRTSPGSSSSDPPVSAVWSPDGSTLVRCSPHPYGIGIDAAAARVDALVGLAADAVGGFDAPTAVRLLAVAAAAGHPAWRPRVRAGWVGAEAALVAGDPRAAVPPAEEALELAQVGGSVRHVVKSRLVLAVVRGVVDGPSREVLDRLDRVVEDADRSGFRPLVWPAHLAASDVAELGRWPPVTESLLCTDEGTESPRKRSHVMSVDGRRAAAAAGRAVLYQLSGPLGRRLTGESMGRVSR